LKPTLQQGAKMADDNRVRIQLVDGRHLEAKGTLEQVAERLAPGACRAHGFCEVQDTRGNAVLVNRDHVLYLERRGAGRGSLVR
jgi:DNA-binding LytR/AlgR family response regulator